MKKRKFVFWIGGIILFLIVSFAVITYAILTFDPWGWGKIRSSKFSWDKFSEIKVGEDIDAVIDLLGAPVRPAEPLTVLTNNPRDPCLEGGCKKYLFAGGAWGPTFKEAIVIVDSHRRVVSANARQE